MLALSHLVVYGAACSSSQYGRARPGQKLRASEGVLILLGRPPIGGWFSRTCRVGFLSCMILGAKWAPQESGELSLAKCWGWLSWYWLSWSKVDEVPLPSFCSRSVCSDAVLTELGSPRLGLPAWISEGTHSSTVRAESAVRETSLSSGGECGHLRYELHVFTPEGNHFEGGSEEESLCSVRMGTLGGSCTALV